MTTEPVKTTHASRVFEATYVEDGYSFIGVGEKHGWRAVSSWGLDGWDLGDWPYVVYLFRDRELSQLFERVCYVEGDITIEAFTTAEAREKATDESALFYWKDEEWVVGPNKRSAADLAGPYSNQRSQQHRDDFVRDEQNRWFAQDEADEKARG